MQAGARSYGAAEAQPPGLETGVAVQEAGEQEQSAPHPRNRSLLPLPARDRGRGLEQARPAAAWSSEPAETYRSATPELPARADARLR